MSISISTPSKISIVQIAYVVDDLEEAAKRWCDDFGVGPFLVIRHLPMLEVRYRGAPSSVDISIALAQAGDVQIELIVQHCDTPSVFREGPNGTAPRGPHHVAIYPEDFDAMIAHYVDRGFPVAGENITGKDSGVAYIDTSAFNGHMVEVYRPSERLEDVFAMVRAGAEKWDRRTPLIEMSKG